MSLNPVAFGATKLIPFAHPQAVANPELLFSGYFQASTEGLCILDSGLRFLAVNGRLAQMSGVSVADHLGKTVREVVGAVADLVEPLCRQVLATGEPMLNLEISATLPTRTEVGHWLVHYFPIRDANGMTTRIGVVAVEITEQKKVQESLRRLSGNLKKETQRLQMLIDVGNILAASVDGQQSFPMISARIRRLLHHEYAGLELHDATNGLLVRHAEDFPLGKGLLAGVPISAATAQVAGRCRRAFR